MTYQIPMYTQSGKYFDLEHFHKKDVDIFVAFLGGLLGGGEVGEPFFAGRSGLQRENGCDE